MNEILSNWIFYALLAPLLWVIANFIEKYSLGKYTRDAHDFIFFGSLLNWCLFALLVFKFGLPNLSLYSLVPIALGMLFIAAYWFYAKALRVSETSQLIISFKSIPVLTLLFAFVFLGQSLSGADVLAFIVVLVGTLLVSVEKIEGTFTITEGTKWIIGAIIIWGAMFTGVDWALTKISFWNYLTLEVLGMSIAGTSLLVLPQIRHDLVASVKTATFSKYFWFGLIKIFDFSGQMLIKTAFVLGTSAGLVTVVMQVQSIYGIIIGTCLTLWLPHIIKEDISRQNIIKKVLGTIIMLAGICLLFLG